MQTVNHNQFGKGTVVSQDDTTVTVDFNGTVKKLVTAFARLTNEDGTAFGAQFVAPAKKTKKLNASNFKSHAELGSKSYNDMTSDEKYAFQLEREAAARNSVKF